MKNLLPFIDSEEIHIDFIREISGYRIILRAKFIDGSNYVVKELSNLDETFLFLDFLYDKFSQQKNKV